MTALSLKPEAAWRGESQKGRWATVVEILLVYAGILLYIWRWQTSHRWLWTVLLAVIVASHFFHHDSIRWLGLTGSDFVRSGRAIFPLAAIAYTPLILFGFIAHRPIPPVSAGRGLAALGAYALWCAFQQYLTQSYFHRRLMRISRTPWLNSILVGLLFGSAHIPNPILMPATFLGGVVFAEVFRRYPNIWPLAIVQAVGGILIGWISPPALIHNMRVGPGYFSPRMH
jgi:hypothetical protein